MDYTEFSRTDGKVTLNAFFGTKMRKHFRIKKVIFNDPATIILWHDGTKTVVKTQNGEKYDPEKGMAMAISKKCFGNAWEYYSIFKKWVPYDAVKAEEEEDDETIDIYGDGRLLAVITPIKNPGPVKDYFDMGNGWVGKLSNGKYGRVSVSFEDDNDTKYQDEAFLTIRAGDRNELNEAFNSYAKCHGLQYRRIVVTDITVLRTSDTIYDVE
jgi:hypothetical protein